MAQASTTSPAVANQGAGASHEGEIDRWLQSLAPAERATLRGNRELMDRWLRQRLVAQALFEEAQHKGWADRPEVKASIAAAAAELTQRLVASSYLASLTQLPAEFPSDAEISAAYELGKPGFNLPAAYRISQIFVAAPAGDASANAKAKSEAQQLAKQARTGDFAELARQHSNDPRTAARGGEVGLLSLVQLLPEVRTPVTKLKVGEVSDALPTNNGFHIIKLLELQPARVATLEEMKPQLQAALRQQRQQQLVQKHLAEIAAAGDVYINSAAVDAALQKLN